MYAIVDIETTGGYADNHRVTEIAVYHHDGNRITDTFHTLLNPGRNIPGFITGLTGITSQMVSKAPTFDEMAPEIQAWLKDRVFVAGSPLPGHARSLLSGLGRVQESIDGLSRAMRDCRQLRASTSCSYAIPFHAFHLASTEFSNLSSVC